MPLRAPGRLPEFSISKTRQRGNSTIEKSSPISGKLALRGQEHSREDSAAAPTLPFNLFLQSFPQPETSCTDSALGSGEAATSRDGKRGCLHHFQDARGSERQAILLDDGIHQALRTQTSLEFGEGEVGLHDV